MFVRSTNVASGTTVNAGGGSDTLTVGSVGDILESINGALTVIGGDGMIDQLVLTDGAYENAAGIDYTLTSGTVDRAGAALVTYQSVDRLELFGGVSGNRYHVLSTNPETATTVNTTKNGTDTIDIHNNSFTLDDLLGQLTVTTSVNDVVNIKDTDSLAEHSYEFDGSVLTRDGWFPITIPFALNVYLITGRNQDTVRIDQLNNGTNLYVSTGDGNDSVSVVSTGQNSYLQIVTGGEDDTIVVGGMQGLSLLWGEIIVNGGSGYDSLEMNDEGSWEVRIFTLTDAVYSRDGSAFIFHLSRGPGVYSAEGGHEREYHQHSLDQGGHPHESGGGCRRRHGQVRRHER